MLRMLIKKRSVTALLSVLVLLSLWTSAMAGVFCPHMRGGDCCMFSDRAHLHRQTTKQDDPASVEHAHINHEQMSDMDMEDGSMDMASTQSPPEEQDSNDMTQMPAPMASDELAPTRENEPCSHCMMYSRSDEQFPASYVENNVANQIISADTSATSLSSVPTAFEIVELHDHGPPGSVAPLYILVSSFRI